MTGLFSLFVSKRWICRPGPATASDRFVRRGEARPVQWRCSLASGLAAAVLFGAGCGSATWLRNGFVDPGQVGNFQNPARLEIRESLSILEEPFGIPGAEEPTAEDLLVSYEEARIAPGDIVRISIFELLTPTVSTDQQFLVRNSGFQTLSVLGPVKVAGLTARELELDIKATLREAQILDDAEVQVSILRSVALEFSILGQVSNPGNLPIPRPDYRLMNALAAAGGIPPQVETIYVIRGGARDRGPEPDAEAATPESAPHLPAPEQGTSPLMLSDLSAGPTTASTATTPSSGPNQADGVDELEILEGKPRGQSIVPSFDQATGQWVISGADSQPTDSAPEAGAEEDGSSQASSSTSEPGPSGGPPISAEAPSSQKAESLEPTVRIIEIPTKALLEGDIRYNIVIRPNDLIDVPPTVFGEYYMGGNIARPGAYSLTGRRITVKQAVVAAGGFGPLAWPSRADLIRRVSNNEEQMIQIDLDAIYAGKTPDFYLRPNDVVNVGTTPAAMFLAVLRNAFRLSYGFGFVYDRNFADKDSFGAEEQRKNRKRIEAQARGLPF